MAVRTQCTRGRSDQGQDSSFFLPRVLLTPNMDPLREADLQQSQRASVPAFQATQEAFGRAIGVGGGTRFAGAAFALPGSLAQLLQNSLRTTTVGPRKWIERK